MFREKKLAEISCKSGGFTEEFAMEKFGINSRRLKDLCNFGFFEKKPFNIEVEGKLERKYAYDLADKAKEYVKQSGICEVTQGLNGYRHTVATQEVVYNLVQTEKVDIKNILNEKEQEKYFGKQISNAKSKGLKFRVNDLAVVSSGGNIRSIEIDTDYPEKLKLEHMTYAQEVLQVPYETIYG